MPNVLTVYRTKTVDDNEMKHNCYWMDTYTYNVLCDVEM